MEVMREITKGRTVLAFNKMKRLLLVCAGIAALLGIANFIGDYYVRIRLGPTVAQFRRARPAAYAYSHFYSIDFIDEQTALSESWRQGDTWTGWDSNFHGHFFNTDHGIRRTAFQPPDARNTVWMLGNSTLFDYEVPDELTIASQLQRLLNGAFGPRYRVVNLGQTGLGVSENVSLLKKLPVQPGDLVIQYDGLSEAFTLRLSQETHRSLRAAGMLCNALASGPIRWWGIVKLYCLWADSTLPAAIVDSVPPTLARATQRFQDSLTEGFQYSIAHGAAYYHFLPPHIWSQPPSAYEQLILDDPYLTPPGTGQSFALMWPALQGAQVRLARAGVRSYDLTHCLDPLRSSGRELYLDFVHVNEQADAIIAQAIFQAINVF